MNHDPLSVGAVLGGKYRVERQLGQGNMGVVLAARSVNLGRPCAIKLILAQRGGQKAQEEARSRFLREARAAAMLSSTHAVKIWDTGTLEDGSPFMVMELLDGKDLAVVLRERGPLPVDDAVTYVLQVCEAVAEAHAKGIVHRDLKPANLFLTTGFDGGPVVKVVDFGISRIAADAGRLTGTGIMLGSPFYMSPEAMRAARDVDGRADVWALGVILYELLTGKTPFRAETIEQVMAKILFEPPVPIETHRPGLPASLVAVILQALEKDRDRRFGSVAAFGAALAPHASPRSARYVARIAGAQGVELAPSRATDLLPPEPAPAGAAPVPVPAFTAAHTLASAKPSGVSFRTLIAVVAVTILLVLGAVYVALLSTAKPPPVPPDAGAAPARSAVALPAEVPIATTTASAVVVPPPAVAPASSPSASASAPATRTPAPRASMVPRSSPSPKPRVDDTWATPRR